MKAFSVNIIRGLNQCNIKKGAVLIPSQFFLMSWNPFDDNVKKLRSSLVPTVRLVVRASYDFLPDQMERKPFCILKEIIFNSIPEYQKIFVCIVPD